MLAGQLARLAALAERDHVVLQILPFGHGAYPAMGVAFTLFGFADPADPRLVYLEQLTGNTLLEAPEDVERYAAAFAETAAAALDPAASAELIRSLAG